METLSSALDPNSDEFNANAEHNRALTAELLKKRLALVRQGGGEKYRQPEEQAEYLTQPSIFSLDSEISMP